MMVQEVPRNDADTVTIRVDFSLRQHGGKKLIIAPAGEPNWAPPHARIDNTLVKALARAFRWRNLLENETYSTVAELAVAEKINGSYVSRILRLTLLAPEIVEAILDGMCGPEMTFAKLTKPFPLEWENQRKGLNCGCLP